MRSFCDVININPVYQREDGTYYTVIGQGMGFMISGESSGQIYSQTLDNSITQTINVKNEPSTIQPESVLDEETGIYRMNIDIGSQSQDGKEMQVIGDVGRQESSMGTALIC